MGLIWLMNLDHKYRSSLLYASKYLLYVISVHFSAVPTANSCPPRTASESAGLLRISVGVRQCPTSRSPPDSGGVRFCPADCPPHNDRHGQFCVRQCPRRKLFGRQSAGQHRTPPDSESVRVVRQGNCSFFIYWIDFQILVILAHSKWM